MSPEQIGALKRMISVFDRIDISGVGQNFDAADVEILRGFLFQETVCPEPHEYIPNSGWPPLMRYCSNCKSGEVL